MSVVITVKYKSEDMQTFQNLFSVSFQLCLWIVCFFFPFSQSTVRKPSFHVLLKQNHILSGLRWCCRQIAYPSGSQQTQTGCWCRCLDLSQSGLHHQICPCQPWYIDSIALVCPFSLQSWILDQSCMWLWGHHKECMTGPKRGEGWMKPVGSLKME